MYVIYFSLIHRWRPICYPSISRKEFWRYGYFLCFPQSQTLFYSEIINRFSYFLLTYEAIIVGLKENVKEYSSQLWSSSSDPISIEGDRIALQWPHATGWNITPDREPCEVCVYIQCILAYLIPTAFGIVIPSIDKCALVHFKSPYQVFSGQCTLSWWYSYFLDLFTSKFFFQLTKTVLESTEMMPYPPMIKLEIERDPTTNSQCASSVPVEVVGIRERGKKFILKPKLRQSSMCIY